MGHELKFINSKGLGILDSSKNKRRENEAITSTLLTSIFQVESNSPFALFGEKSESEGNIVW